MCFDVAARFCSRFLPGALLHGGLVDGDACGVGPWASRAPPQCCRSSIQYIHRQTRNSSQHLASCLVLVLPVRPHLSFLHTRPPPPSRFQAALACVPDLDPPDSRAGHRICAWLLYLSVLPRPHACCPSAPSAHRSARRSLIPALSHPRTALKTAARPSVQGGGWLREALVVLRLFHARLHLGAPTAHRALLAQFCCPSASLSPSRLACDVCP